MPGYAHGQNGCAVEMVWQRNACVCESWVKEQAGGRGAAIPVGGGTAVGIKGEKGVMEVCLCWERGIAPGCWVVVTPGQIEGPFVGFDNDRGRSLQEGQGEG